ncbi:hypothetical protein TrVE_jg12064 [Triparma verrucosa]|uniref:Uncharacterized protein n=1 Tax=Triparma verrucosa TaxID=1606542 RepID=A0A9W7EU24_9STRA|nr:hypothetical protein TrVE_jg12064 [Triparma verrucosa]
MSVHIAQTPSFSVFSSNDVAPQSSLESVSADLPNNVANNDLRKINLLKLMSTDIQSDDNSTIRSQIRSQIIAALQTHGYILLTYPSSTSNQGSALGSALGSSTSKLHSALLPPLHSTISSIKNLLTSPQNPWPPSSCPLTKGSVYFNENSTPMYKLGYDNGTGGTSDSHNTEDPIREYYRVSSKEPEGSGGFPSDKYGSRKFEIVRILNMCRHVCDCLLSQSLAVTVNRRHRNSGVRSWAEEEKVLRYEGEGGEDDYSILYGMNYFNTVEAVEHARGQGNYGVKDGRLLNLKEHVDPSLWVLEPVLGDGVGGLEVWDERGEKWVLCDGVRSSLNDLLLPGEAAMVAFVGKGFAKTYSRMYPDAKEIKPTLHRVVAPREDEVGKERRSVIFEQKYGEYM